MMPKIPVATSEVGQVAYNERVELVIDVFGCLIALIVPSKVAMLMYPLLNLIGCTHCRL